MKKRLAVLSLLVLLSVPAMAAPRDDDPRGRGNVISRVVRAIKSIVGAVVPLDDPASAVPPHP